MHFANLTNQNVVVISQISLPRQHLEELAFLGNHSSCAISCGAVWADLNSLIGLTSQ